MSLLDRVNEDLKTAMKAKDQLRMDVIRMVKAAILNKQIEVKKEPLDDVEVVRVMTNLVKQRREAVEQYQKAARPDLADRELREITIIEAYLPKPLSAQEMAQVVDVVINETGARTLKDMGTVMKAVMAKLAGQTVDGKAVSDLVRAKLHG